MSTATKIVVSTVATALVVSLVLIVQLGLA